MKIESTERAFKLLINTKGIYKKMGIHRSTVSNMKKAIDTKDKRNMPSLNLMEKLLKKCGSKVIREKVWELKIMSKTKNI